MIYKCRSCGSGNLNLFVDLNFSPPSNAYLSEHDLSRSEVYYPLKVVACEDCLLVQTLDYVSEKDMFCDDYAYLSSTSSTWLDHCAKYVDSVVTRENLNSKSTVVEIASNDGYLLKNFKSKGIPCFGIEPTAGTAAIAKENGIETIVEFFTSKLAARVKDDGRSADLIIGNNVYAHVPDIVDFTNGMEILLKDEGVLTLEFPHLLELLKLNQFDTIYHEHFSYLSLAAVSAIFQRCGLEVFDVESLSTHGGSLRIYGCKINSERTVSKSVFDTLDAEKDYKIFDTVTFEQLQRNLMQIKLDLISFLIEAKKDNKKVVAYGAAAKGNTLLNFCGINSDLLSVVFDGALSKQGMLMPGSHIPIKSPSSLRDYDPDYVLILPWNIKDEIIKKVKELATKDCQFVTAIPSLEIFK